MRPGGAQIIALDTRHHLRAGGALDDVGEAVLQLTRAIVGLVGSDLDLLALHAIFGAARANAGEELPELGSTLVAVLELVEAVTGRLEEAVQAIAGADGGELSS